MTDRRLDTPGWPASYHMFLRTSLGVYRVGFGFVKRAVRI